MPVRPLLRLIALGTLGASLFAGTASAAEYATLNLDISVDKPADVVWKKVGGYCAISDWLKLTCVMTSGTGDLGSVRRLADRIDEVMVSQTAHSYTYTQPTSTILYHGKLEVVPDGKKKSKILYSLFWDQAPLADAAAKSKDVEQRRKSFTTALENMKKLSEEK
ncbi:MAG: SRPBCC family protein [Gammaproteobacteria bacterium]